jgi:class 3 adenylate cyclase/tetratricopeptide (TPR) repeat protein
VATSTFPGPSSPASELVGRRLELGWLRSRCSLATQGYPHLVLIEGEPGIGKTRLAQEALAEARQAGATVLRGRCYAHLDLAYLPLRESLLVALTRFLSGRPGREADRQLVAELRALGEPEAVGERPAEAMERDRTQRLLGLTELVIELAADGQLVLFLDDLDWSDGSTVDLLRHLLFRLDDEDVPLLLLATTRADPQARAAEAVAVLRSEPRTAVLLLHALSALEAVQLTRALHPDTSLDRAREVASASGGNPLLVEALGRDASGAGTPSLLGRGPGHPVTAAIDATLAQLTPETAEVVRAVSVLVPESTPELLAGLTGLDQAAVHRALREAVEASVLVDDGAAIAFSHPLYGHRIRAQGSATARRALHAAAAATLRAHRDAGTAIGVRSIAHHLIAAEVPLPRGSADGDDVRQAADEALAIGAWSEAARCYEALLAAGDAVDGAEVADLHRLAGMSRRGNLQLAEGVAHFEAAIEAIGADADAATMAELHLWRIRCGIGTQEMLDTVTDRGPLEELVDEIEGDHPQLAAAALVELSQSYWVEWRLDEAEATARRAMAIADRCGDQSAYVRATAVLIVPQWARYDLEGSLATLRDGVAHARMADDESVIGGGPLFRLPLVLTWLGHLDEAEATALECCAHADEMQYPLELGLPLAALTQIAVLRGDYDQAEQHAHRALLLQRLSGYHWAAGLFLPAVACARVARGRFELAREALDTWAETANVMEQATIGLLSRYVAAAERGLAVQGSRLPQLPPAPMIGAEGWAAIAVELARREGRGDVDAAHRLLAEAEQRGGVFSSGLITLLPRVRAVALDLLGDEDGAVVGLQDAIGVAVRHRVEPERARAQVDLATILMRRGDQADGLALLEDAVATFHRLDMPVEADRARQLAGHSAESASTPTVETTFTSVVFFTDVVDSTRLTEELGAGPYRGRARLVEQAVTSAITAHGGTVVPGISLGDGFIGLFPAVGQALDAARQCVTRVESTGLHLHLALHQGEVLVDGPRVYGPAVNLAARVCGLSGPDEILVSDVVHAAAAGTAGVLFVDRGEHALKGITAAQRVFALIDDIDAD